MTMKNQTLLELHVEDFGPIKQYYQALGFEIAWEREPEEKKGYLVMHLHDNILCFWAGNQHVYKQSYFKRFPKDTPRGYGVEIVIMVDDIDAFYESHKDTANVSEPLTMQPWGLKDFRAVDPAGFYLRFTSKHDILDNSNAIK